LKVLYATDLTVTDGMKALFIDNSAMLAKPYAVEQLLTSFFPCPASITRREARARTPKSTVIGAAYSMSGMPQ